MKYEPILEVLLTHPFYLGGNCVDLALVPSAETEARLRSHRCLVRSGAGQARVTTAVNDAGAPLLPLPEGAALRFSIEARDTRFALVTDFSPLKPLLADSPPDAKVLTEPLFTNAPLAAGAAGDLALVFEDRPRRTNVVAEVEIVLHPQGVGRAPPMTAFSARFQSKSVYWAYYCVTDLPPGGAALSVVDAAQPEAGAEPILFSDVNRTEVDVASSGDDPVAALLLQQNPGVGVRCVRFVSDAPVPLREAPRRHIELRVGDDRLSSPLANPSTGSPSSIVMPVTAGPPLRREALIRIIKYRRQTA